MHVVNITLVDAYTNLTSIGNNYKINSLFFIGTNQKLLTYYNISMREMNKYLYMIDLLFKYYNDYDSLREKGLLKFVLIPYCLALKIKNIKIFNEFISGRNIEDFISIMKLREDVYSVVNELKNRDTSYKNKEITCEEYVKEIYNIYFNNPKLQEYFKQQNRKMFLDVISLIGNFTTL